MYRIVLYSFTIIAVFCVAALAGERSVIQVQQGEAPPIAKPNYGLAQVVPLPAPARPQVPGGVSVQPVTSQLRKPRLIRVAPNGDKYCSNGFLADHRIALDCAGFLSRALLCEPFPLQMKSAATASIATPSWIG